MESCKRVVNPHRWLYMTVREPAFQAGAGYHPAPQNGIGYNQPKMIENFRQFQAGPDPFGRKWQVHFSWLQTGISIRHADTVDVKFGISCEGEPYYERVIALPHPALLALGAKVDHPLTDSWCMKIAALHLQHIIESGEDFEKVLVTVQPAEMEQYARELQPAPVHK